MRVRERIASNSVTTSVTVRSLQFILAARKVPTREVSPLFYKKCPFVCKTCPLLHKTCPFDKIILSLHYLFTLKKNNALSHSISIITYITIAKR